MPYSTQEKKRALVRVRRIGGQLDALAQALEQEADCGAVLQQIAAIRGAVNGLMGEVLESHLRASFVPRRAATADAAALEQTIALLRTYLK
ncbi:metal/formaldehyde-sensitive transcriptional repressor [Rhodanobacter sp. PCA2]|uniref:metal/formaldehyde-sensitive transcriptional repressor n=1 Tax=Rhodanobacter sp. PCA2 TaxID=2006117 RepID=UPI0015E67C42|nr:metal/formaldehyde-sensitive transcriptional repressor [Rhodanobacter sp. PCA2]MBA2079189.1 regulator [Rhodanobacter sp. PCA2]